MFESMALFMFLHMFICFSAIFALFLIALWFIKFATAKQLRRWAFFFIILALIGMITSSIYGPQFMSKQSTASGYTMRFHTGSGEPFTMHNKRFN